MPAIFFKKNYPQINANEMQGLNDLFADSIFYLSMVAGMFPPEACGNDGSCNIFLILRYVFHQTTVANLLNTFCNLIVSRATQCYTV